MCAGDHEDAALTTVADARAVYEERQDQDTRTCRLCGDPVEGGLDGMEAHLLQDHSRDEIVEAVSFAWQPPWPVLFIHPSGTIHFVDTSGDNFVVTRCGQRFDRTDFDDISVEEWRTQFITYEPPAEFDGCCGNCRSVHEHQFPDPLPEWLTAGDDA